MGNPAIYELTKSLVDVPESDSERAAGSLIVDWLRSETSAEVTRDDGGNVVARKGSGGPSLALVGHHDVVDPAQSQIADGRHRVSEENGRLQGRGTADMKGALAAMMVAFQRADPDSVLIFASFVGEERGGIGAQSAIEDGLKPDFAIVGEGSASYSREGVLDVAIAHKGRRGSSIEATGTSAHASEPAAGDNAIYRALEAVDRIRDLDPPTRTVFGERLAGSLAVTEIDGGTDWNVIPESCSVTVDERTVPGKRADLGIVESIPGVEWTVDQDLPPMRCESREFADQVRAAAAKAQSGTPEFVQKPHATDAGWLAKAGTECVVCGPAEPGEAHSATESVSKSLLYTAFDCYRSVADDWGPL
ncbi:MAG: M20 family metallopeptidase [Halodesulfurarchaeum sp.]